MELVLCRVVRNIGGCVTSLQSPLWVNRGLSITMRKGPLSVKKIGTTQTFQQLAHESVEVEDQEVSQFIKDLIFGDKYSRPFRGQIPCIQVSAVYKIKANKVQLVDHSGSSGPGPREQVDWLERSKARDVPCKELGGYSDQIISKFLDIIKGSRLTAELIKDLKLRDSLQPIEREVLIEMLYNQEKVLAFDFS